MSSAQLKLVDQDAEGFSDELTEGTQLMHGAYTITKFLNAGGFGITYLATDSLDRKIVIKECFPGAFCRRSRAIVQARSRAHQKELASIVRLFVQEARSLAKLEHENIVGVHQVFEDNNTAYMALDFIEGHDLLELLEDYPWEPEPALVEEMLRKLLGAIDFVHAQGMLHRDISPDNILVEEDGNPILIDFGAAREQASKQSRVLSALRVVKDGYSPQEFYITGAAQNASSDLYALGATFFHMITRTAPPDSQKRLAAVAGGEPDPYEPLAGRVDGYETRFLAAIDKSMAIMPKDRMQSATDWLAAMDGQAPLVLDEAVAEVVHKSVPQKSGRMGLVLGSAALLAGLAASIFISQPAILGFGDAPRSTAQVAPPAAPITPAAPVAAPAPKAAEPVALPDDQAVEDEAKALPAQQDMPKPPVLKAATPKITPQSPGAPLDQIPEALVDAPVPAPVTQVVAAPEPTVPQASATSQIAAVAPSDLQVPAVVSEPTIETDTADLPADLPVETPSAVIATSRAPLTTTRPALRPARVASATAETAPEDQISAPLAVSADAAPAVAEVETLKIARETAESAQAVIAPAVATPAAKEQRRTSRSGLPVRAATPVPNQAATAQTVAVVEAQGPTGAASEATLAPAVPVAEAPIAKPTDVEGLAQAAAVELARSAPRPDALIGEEVQFETVEEAAARAPAQVAPTQQSDPTAPTAAIQDVTNVMSAWTVDLPFNAEDRAAPTTLTASEVDWAGAGDQIIAVNEMPITSLREIGGLLRQTIEPAEASALYVTFDLRTPAGETRQQTVSLPIVQSTALLNGVAFETRFDGAAWVSTVSIVPTAVGTDLEVGDIVAAYIPTNQRLQGRTSLSDVITAELARGVETFSFAVLQGGSMWVRSLGYQAAALVND